jgi:hypothetical protein
MCWRTGAQDRLALALGEKMARFHEDASYLLASLPWLDPDLARQRSSHSETPANLLTDHGMNFRDFSECALNRKEN